jgi:hypothetical protein
MKRKLELWRDTETGKITDEWGMEYSIPQLEEASVNSRMFKVGSLDSVGDWTLTGNLTVQSSEWVYLRGPITSSRGLFNGPLTASSLWIRDRSGDANSPQENYGSVRIDGDIEVSGKSINELVMEVKELRKRVKELERRRNE